MRAPGVPQVAEKSKPVASVLRQPAVVVAIDIAPVLPLIESADVVVVERPLTEVVARYKLPPAFLKIH